MVAAGIGAGTVHALCAQWRLCGAAASDAVPRLSRMDRSAGSHWSALGVAGGFRGVGRNDPCDAARSLEQAGCACAAAWLAERDADDRTERAGARRWIDEQKRYQND